MTEITARTPWAGHTGDVPLHLNYFEGCMFEALERIAQKYPKNVAFDFMGKSTTYTHMIEEIKKCARSLKTIGVRTGDKVTIAMPNCPQAIYMFYAVNLVGGIANMIHPLSAEKEIEFYLNESESVTAITLDQFYNKFENIRQNTKVVNIIIASVKDALHRQKLREAHHQVSLQLHRRCAYALRGASASAEHGRCRSSLTQGRILRRRQSEHRAEKEAG